jgi:hypothetical protein
LPARAVPHRSLPMSQVQYHTPRLFLLAALIAVLLAATGRARPPQRNWKQGHPFEPGY